jgi:hypothetical protein
MSKLVYIGGFGNGHYSSRRVGEAYKAYYDEVTAYTFSDAVNDPEVMRKAVEGADLDLHSAAAILLTKLSLKPDRVRLINPPLPRSVASLVVRTVVKTVRMFTPVLSVKNMGDLTAALNYSASSLGELISHPKANFSQLQDISRFNAIEEAIKLQGSGTPTEIIYTTGDAYYKPSKQELANAAANNLNIQLIPGEHDEIAIRPDKLLNTILDS